MEQIANVVQGCVSLLARLMMVAVFLFSAFDSKIRHFSQTAEYMRGEGIPNPRLALFGAIGLILLGGLSLLAGAWTRIGAAFLFVFLAAATFYFLYIVYGPSVACTEGCAWLMYRLCMAQI